MASYSEVTSSSTPIPEGQHLAAMLLSKGSPLTLCHRPTPIPGPNELLIAVHAVAFNPVDCYQRAYGLFISSYPAILGSDIAGVVLSAGSAVPASAPLPGTRVTAFATAFFEQGNPDYGALQTRVLVPAENAAPIPDAVSFQDAAMLPMAVSTTWAGWSTVGLPRETKYTPADKKGLLVWGGSGSVGSVAVQVARMFGFVVYATASEKNHAYVKSLGASRVFDYKNAGVVEEIVRAAKEDGLSIDVAYHATPQNFKETLDVVKALKVVETGKVAMAARMDENSPKVEGVEAKFVLNPEPLEARKEQFRFVFHDWLKGKLASGELVPSPKARVVKGGLGSANEALDELMKGGISSEKLLVEI
ncbi:zinc-binding oxidoreductase-like protein CipB [Mytilinidion resinicola]|uniref:Zinc-binding oxidoreductase-like protein CipB n=1 Tax=Mytilinidion resinicola TaxID=574789 RepID=A0A6A6YV38_9PEZI|nr:zinc-binding oxidoreductase-like protein CipB [Mytilinidion resinicola]KAF2811835.1 zinc-binding oxidoreductase-like protein CipB [Mytilinidion resinicola]